MQPLNEATLLFILQHHGDDVRQLMLSRPPQDVDLRKACVQIAAWQKARLKLPAWAACDGIIFPEQLPMEQCSSELTARYKAELIAGMELGTKTNGNAVFYMTDLTGGFGVDATMLALSGAQTRLTFIEQNPELCDLARHNLPLMGVKDVQVVCADCEQALHSLPPQHLIFLDPARRNEQGGRTVAIVDCTPDVEQLQDALLEHTEVLMVKLSPMLDLTDALHRLHHVSEVHVVSIDGECKELLLLLRREGVEKGISCVNLSQKHPRQTFLFTREEEQQAACDYTTTLDAYLYEPNASILKAAAFRSVAQRFGLKKLHPNSQLYTADKYIPDFPGRCFAIVDSSDFNKKNLNALLTGISKANLTVRNFPLSVVELRRRLKINEGGNDYLFATTLADEKHVIIRCVKQMLSFSTASPSGI